MVGLTGAVVLTLVAGGRRSSTAYERFRAETLASDLEIRRDGAPADLDPAAVDAIERLPEVEAVTSVANPFIVPAGSGLYPYLDFLAVAGRDRSFGTTVDRPRVLEGRLPAPGAVDEVAVLESYAEDAGVRVGDRVDFESYAPAQLEPLFSGGAAVPVAAVALVVGAALVVANLAAALPARGARRVAPAAVLRAG